MIDLFDAVEQEFFALHEEPDAAAMRAELLRPVGT